MKLRVIAVERNSIENIDSQTVFTCVYKNKNLYLYGTEEGDGGLVSDYFSNFEMLEYFVTSNKYEWTDFYIEKGSKITRDRFDDIIVNGESINAFEELIENNIGLCEVSLMLYYEFLRTFYNNKPDKLEQLKELYETNELKKSIMEMLDQNPFNDFNDLDKLFVIKTRLEGYHYLVNYVSNQLKSNNDYGYQAINFFFSRIFKLEKYNYINLSLSLENN